MRKNIIWNIIGTTLNAFNSLFFFIIIVRINGVEDGGIFTLAFSLACLFCIIGAYSGRVFQVTDIKNELNNKEYILNRVISCIFMILIAYGYTFFKGYDFYKTSVTMLLMLFKCNEVFSEVFYGILQKNDQLHIVGKSLTFKSLASIIILLLVNLITKDMIVSFIFVNISWLLSTIFYDIPSAIKFIKKEEILKFKNSLKLYKIGFFTFAFTFLSIYLINIPRYTLDGRLSEALQAIYGIILMPGTIVSLGGQYLLSPYLKSISHFYADGEKEKFKNVIKKIIYVILIMGLFVLFVTWLFGIEILNIVYGLDLYKYMLHLLIIIVGAILYTISVAYSTALTAIRHTFIQFIIYISLSLIGTFISIFLIDYMGFNGAVLSYVIIMLLLFVFYHLAYVIIIKKISFIKKEY